MQKVNLVIPLNHKDLWSKQVYLELGTQLNNIERQFETQYTKERKHLPTMKYKSCVWDCQFLAILNVFYPFLFFGGDCFETGVLCASLTFLTCSVTRLSLNMQWFICLCFPRAGIEGVCHLCLFVCLITSTSVPNTHMLKRQIQRF